MRPFPFRVGCLAVILFSSSLASVALADAEPVQAPLSLAERYWEPRPRETSETTGPWGFLFNQGATGDYCQAGYAFPLATVAPTVDQSTLPVDAQAQRGSYRIGEGATLTGDVRLVQGDRTLESPSADIDLNTGQAVFPDLLRLLEPGLILEGVSAQSNINTRATTLDGVEFLLNPAQFRGRAARVDLDEAQSLAVTGATLTRCPPGNNSWRVSAGRLRIDDGASYAVVRRAVLKVGPVPVFYAPYIRFPINDGRQSGWLFPTLAYSSEDGTDFALPYYFNLAPNYDATVTPRLISERGLGLEAEGRYLNRYGRFALTGAFLPDDDLYDGSLQRNDFNEQFPAGSFEPADRWLYGMNHSGGVVLPRGRLRSFIDYAAVSDGDYFRDLGSDLGVSSRVELQRLGELVYQLGGFEARLWAQRFQVLDEDLRDPYQRLPELALTYEGQLAGPLRWSMGAAWADFDRDTRGLSGLSAVTGRRSHYNPRLDLSFYRPYGSLSFAAGMHYTRYDLEGESNLPAGFDDSPERAIAFGRVDGGLVFERPVSLFGGSFIQTLEPRLFYLHQDFEEQSLLPTFDTTSLTFQYRQLFRENRFSGTDRFGDANQLSVGVTSRLLDNASGREWLRASVGQIRYFEDRRGHPKRIARCR